MPTPLELKNPELTYCAKWNIHCPCLHCIKELYQLHPPLHLTNMSMKKELEIQCENCTGINEDITNERLKEIEKTNIAECDDMSFCTTKIIRKLEKLGEIFL